MGHSDADSKFIKEVAYWLPLDGVVFAVRKCLSDMIGAMDGSKHDTDAPVEPMSRWFALVHTHECPAFEELCDCIKEYPPGTIPEPHVYDILRLARILASRTEEVLPDDDTSGNDLRNAITSLYTLACNTPKNLTSEAFAAKVEETRKAICDGFKSLSNGFRKIERKRDHGSNSELAKVDLSDNAKKFIQGVGDGVSGKIDGATEDMNERLNNQADCIESLAHEVKLARKNQIVTTKGFKPAAQEKAFNYWVAALARFGQKHIRTDGFAFFAKDLKDIGITDADVWNTVKEQWRSKKRISIKDAVKAYNSEATKTIVRK